MPASDRVLLICMPMGLVQTPNLGLSLLKAAVERQGTPCDVRYLSVELLEHFIGDDDAIPRYVKLVDQPPLSEVCASFFAARRFGPDPARDALVAERLQTVTAAERDFIAQIQNAVDPFLEYCLDAIPWDRYRIVGFTSLFAGMTTPSALLAGRVKARHPHVVTLLGGWNTGGEMGTVIAERLCEFDYVLRGESDETFPLFVSRILAGRSPDGLAGLVRRESATGGVRSWPQAVVRDLDALPYPDFTDYFATMAAGRFRGTPPGGWSVPFESSRGCWWGEVSHCKFCGLNGLSMAYRSKSPERLLDEVDRIVANHRPRLLFAADTVLDTKYFKSVVPTLRAKYPDVHLAYEVKAPVKREQMAKLAEASIDQVTIGIESLSTRVLKLMDKGSTSLKNVHCLRLAREFGIEVGWQYLYGFPGEQIDDYTGAAAALPLLHHLSPPLQACRVTLARFSPYFDRAREHGVAAVRAHRDYRLSFSWPQEDLNRVAYHFEFDFADGRSAELTDDIGFLMDGAVADWRARHAQARLELRSGRVLAWVVDTRFDAPKVYVLDGAGQQILEALDSDVSLAQVYETLMRRAAEDPLSALLGLLDCRDTQLLIDAQAEADRLGTTAVRIPSPWDCLVPPVAEEASPAMTDFLELLLSLGLVLCEQGRWISLAVPARAGERR